MATIMVNTLFRSTNLTKHKQPTGRIIIVTGSLGVGQGPAHDLLHALIQVGFANLEC